MKKNILISNGRSPATLDFVRNLHASGHEIFVAETSRYHLCNYSNAVKKSLIVPSPRFMPEQHIKALNNIILQYKIDLFIPAWEDIFLVSSHLDQFPDFCRVFATEFALLHKLHNKASYMNYLNELGIDTPKSVLIRSFEELKQVDIPCYALKACYSRGSAKVYKIKAGDPLPPITPSEKEPWLAQEWLDGKSFCTFTICHNGKVHAHTTYPTELSMETNRSGGAAVGNSCLTFRHIDHKEILKWTEEFVRKTNFTGQLAFDFIELPDGKLHTIECNPRMTHGVTLFTSSDQFDQAILGLNETLITPKASMRKQIAVGMLLYGWRSALKKKTLSSFFKSLLECKDIVFHLKDPKPFLCMPFLWIKYLKDSRSYKKNVPSAFTYDLDFE